MKKWTQELLEAEGYEIHNVQIKNVSLSMADHGVLTSDLTLDGHGWGVCYGGYVLGKGYVGAKNFEGHHADYGYGWLRQVRKYERQVYPCSNQGMG